jgi:dephospho-CoA kinase
MCRYFFMNATKELGLNANALPEPIQGHLLVQQIEEYAKAHYWVSVLSLESIHRYESIAEAKRVLGPLLHIIYVDASEDVRIQREVSRVGSKRTAEMVEEEVRRKDEIKRARGAHRVLEIADTVLDNHGSVENTCRVLYALLDYLTR